MMKLQTCNLQKQPQKSNENSIYLDTFFRPLLDISFFFWRGVFSPSFSHGNFDLSPRLVVVVVVVVNTKPSGLAKAAAATAGNGSS